MLDWSLFGTPHAASVMLVDAAIWSARVLDETLVGRDNVLNTSFTVQLLAWHAEAADRK